mmetsp:Transcript_1537/g.4211  ORF Transcript_1537/g.4211 Transcript_1537/m.4211 type:complete len:228 (+) Transcript_1537:595-1278(+)
MIMSSNLDSSFGTCPVRSLPDRSRKTVAETSIFFRKSLGIVPNRSLSDKSTVVSSCDVANDGMVSLSLLPPIRSVLSFVACAKEGTVPVKPLSANDNVSTCFSPRISSGILPARLLNRTSRSTRLAAPPIPSRLSSLVESRRRLLRLVASAMPSKLKFIGLEYNHRFCRFFKPNSCLGGFPVRLLLPRMMDSTVWPSRHEMPYHEQMSMASSSQPSLFFQPSPPVAE